MTAPDSKWHEGGKCSVSVLRQVTPNLPMRDCVQKMNYFPERIGEIEVLSCFKYPFGVRREMNFMVRLLQQNGNKQL